MSSVSAQLDSVIDDSMMYRARLGLSFIRDNYGEQGVERLKARVKDLEVATDDRCPFAIGSGTGDYHTTARKHRINDITQAAFGFLALGKDDVNQLTAAWRALILSV